ncbi:MAG TPA: hypothetical protein VGH43_06805 [Jatrophihabitans sp.]|jgi:hypothetical protein
MPRTTKSEAPVAVDTEQFTARYVELGPYTVGYESFPQDVDPAPLFAGLPDSRCQCPHWGIVVSGQIVFRYPDHEETFRAGDSYYGGPGHLPLIFAGTEVIEFSPTEKFKETAAVLDVAMATMSEG